jgi:polar amino acid transport system substrate-binding protein
MIPRSPRRRSLLLAAAAGLLGGGMTTAARAQKARPAAKAYPAIASGKDLRLDGIRNRGVLLIGVSQFVPWVFKDPKGEWYGFEVDVSRQLASEIGVQPAFVELPFRSLISAVVAGDIDVIASGMSITPERALAVDFSQAYSRSELEFAVRAGAAGTQDFNVAGTRIGVVSPSLLENIARETLANASLQGFATDAAAYAALADGSVAAVLQYAPAARIEALRAPDRFAVATNRTPLAHSVEAFAVRHGEPTLLNVLNAWIAFHRADGWLDERHRDWFESLNWVARLAPPPQ